jgi:large subunit ribosomal protein L13
MTYLRSPFSEAVKILIYSTVDTLSYKTVSANSATVNKKWLVIDAEGQTLGRLSTVVASLLRGKHKTNFTPHVDCGDYVIVVNAEKVALSGNKWDSKIYLRHTGYPGGQRERTAREVLQRKPADLVEKAVRGMLPKNRLGRELFRNLHVVVGPEHNHQAQQPAKYELK